MTPVRVSRWGSKQQSLVIGLANSGRGQFEYNNPSFNVTSTDMDGYWQWQCHRSQKFGYEQPSVTCSGLLLTTECKKEKDSPPNCANCINEHHAFYNECKARPKIKAITPKMFTALLR